MRAQVSEQDMLAMLRESARQWVEAEHPAAPNEMQSRAGLRERWAAMAMLGWTGMTVAESAGGLGLGARAWGEVAEALGRELVATPMVGSALVAPGLLAGRDALLAQMVDGSAIIALAFGEDAHHSEKMRATARRAGDGWQLTARKCYVADGAVADWFLVNARADGAAMFLVPRDACDVVALETIDGRAMAHVAIDAALPLTSRLDVDAAGIERAADLARIGLACEMLGAATRSFEITLDYLKMREQFARPIGSFQALQHRAAQMLVAIELARASLNEALDLAETDAVLKQPAAVAKFMAGEALHLATER